jgi:cysteinyl-tRNA synthetase
VWITRLRHDGEGQRRLADNGDDWEPPALSIPEDILALASEREKARAERDWARADEIRETLKGRGWQVEDSKCGQRLTADSSGRLGAPTIE